jgi:hypothetical protein
MPESPSGQRQSLHWPRKHESERIRGNTVPLRLPAMEGRTGPGGDPKNAEGNCKNKKWVVQWIPHGLHRPPLWR